MLLNRFYRAATRALLRRDTVIDKLIGDEVMTLLLKASTEPNIDRQRLMQNAICSKPLGYGTEKDS